MQQKHKRRIEEIKGQIDCPKMFICLESGFDQLCNANDIGIDSYVECKEEFPLKCKLSLPYGNIYICKCQLRVYIEKNLKK